MSTYFIESSTLTDLADSIRNMRKEKGTMTPSQMKAKIEASTLGIPVTVHINKTTGKWERPQEYPDLDSIVLPQDFDGVYMTYDLRKTPGMAWIGIHASVKNGGSFDVDRGHLENNVFVSDETHRCGNGTYFRQDLDMANGDIQLWRVKSVNTADSRVPLARLYVFPIGSSLQIDVTPGIEHVKMYDGMKQF